MVISFRAIVAQVARREPVCVCRRPSASFWKCASGRGARYIFVHEEREKSEKEEDEGILREIAIVVIIIYGLKPSRYIGNTILSL